MKHDETAPAPHDTAHEMAARHLLDERAAPFDVHAMLSLCAAHEAREDDCRVAW